MAFQSQTLQDRATTILAYLRTIAPDGQVEAVRDRLESASSDSSSGDELEVFHGSEGSALETLDVLIEDGVRGDLSPDRLDQLEAIIHKSERPAVDIINGTFRTPPAPWREYGLGETKRRLESVIPSIGCIELPNDSRGRPYGGTGFVVGPNLIMTNRHVARIFADGVGQKNLRFVSGQTAAVDFKREIPRPGDPDPILLSVSSVEMVHPFWDMALLRVEGLPEEHPVLQLTTKSPLELAGRNIAVIGYPAQDDRSNLEVQNRIFGGVFEVKRMLPGKLAALADIESFGNIVTAVTHDSSTLGGNSGSAVIDVDTGEVVALHFAGQYLVANYAVPTFDLAQDSRVVDAGLNFAGRLDPRGDFYGPIWTKADANESATGSPGASSVSLLHSPQPPNRRAAAAMTSATVTNQTATWTIPLQVCVTVGTPQMVTAGTANVPGSTPGTGKSAGQVRSDVEGLFSSGRSAAMEAAVPFLKNSLTETNFQWKTALSMAVAGRLAYDKASVVRDTARGAEWGFEFCDFIEADDTQCFVASSSQAVLLSFRGTENVGDWISDLNAFSTSRPYGDVHRGFLAAFQVVETQLKAILAGLAGRPLLLTGHSLGGALATVAAAEWQGQIPIAKVYTFGQPAVGKGSFPAFMQQHYSGKFFRVVNDDDIIPMLPPTYPHIGRLFHLAAAAGRLRSGTETISEAALAGTAAADVPMTEGPLAGRPTMSQAEFDQLRADLLRARAARGGGGTESLESLETPALEGLFPSVTDHKIDNYIRKMLPLTGL